MNLEETGILLSKIQAFDNRNVEAASILAWHEILAPHTLNDCLAAVAGYYRENSKWIMPAHVVERAREIEESRAKAFPNGYHLNRIDDERAVESSDWSSSMKYLGRAVRAGALTPAAYETYLASDQPLHEFLGAKELSQ